MFHLDASRCRRKHAKRSLSELDSFNLINIPVYIHDIEKHSPIWGNLAFLDFWGVTKCENTDWSYASESIRQDLVSVRDSFFVSKPKYQSRDWTCFPRGRKVRVRATFSPFWTTYENNSKLALLVTLSMTELQQRHERLESCLSFTANKCWIYSSHDQCLFRTEAARQDPGFARTSSGGKTASPHGLLAHLPSPSAVARVLLRFANSPAGTTLYTGERVLAQQHGSGRRSNTSSWSSASSQGKAQQRKGSARAEARAERIAAAAAAAAASATAAATAAAAGAADAISSSDRQLSSATEQKGESEDRITPHQRSLMIGHPAEHALPATDLSSIAASAELTQGLPTLPMEQRTAKAPDMPSFGLLTQPVANSNSSYSRLLVAADHQNTPAMEPTQFSTHLAKACSRVSSPPYRRVAPWAAPQSRGRRGASNKTGLAQNGGGAHASGSGSASAAGRAPKKATVGSVREAALSASSGSTRGKSNHHSKPRSSSSQHHSHSSRSRRHYGSSTTSKDSGQNDGEGIRWVRVVVVSMVDTVTNELCLLVHEEDITSLKLVEAELREAVDKERYTSITKDKFLAYTSHELRTPVNGIYGLLQYLQCSDLPSQEQEYVSLCLQSTEGLIKLLNQILDLSKIEAGKLELEEQPVPLNAFASMLEEVVDLFAFQKSVSRGVQLVLEYPPQLSLCHDCLEGDLHRIRQIILNLVSNALKFTTEGHVRVRLALHRSLPSQHSRTKVLERIRNIVKSESSASNSSQRAGTSDTGSGSGNSRYSYFAIGSGSGSSRSYRSGRDSSDRGSRGIGSGNAGSGASGAGSGRSALSSSVTNSGLGSGTSSALGSGTASGQGSGTSSALGSGSGTGTAHSGTAGSGSGTGTTSELGSAVYAIGGGSSTGPADGGISSGFTSETTGGSSGYSENDHNFAFSTQFAQAQKLRSWLRRTNRRARNATERLVPKTVPEGHEVDTTLPTTDSRVGASSSGDNALDRSAAEVWSSDNHSDPCERLLVQSLKTDAEQSSSSNNNARWHRGRLVSGSSNSGGRHSGSGSAGVSGSSTEGGLEEEAERAWLVISVEDTGPGISEAGQASVFEKFAQAGQGGRTKYGGTGLGLTISRQLARLMGGDIILQSQEGVGSKFSLLLSLKICPNGTAPPALFSPVTPLLDVPRQWGSLQAGTLTELPRKHPLSAPSLTTQQPLARPSSDSGTEGKPSSMGRSGVNNGAAGAGARAGGGSGDHGNVSHSASVFFGDLPPLASTSNLTAASLQLPPPVPGLDDDVALPSPLLHLATVPTPHAAAAPTWQGSTRSDTTKSHSSSDPELAAPSGVGGIQPRSPSSSVPKNESSEGVITANPTNVVSFTLSPGNEMSSQSAPGVLPLGGYMPRSQERVAHVPPIHTFFHISSYLSSSRARAGTQSSQISDGQKEHRSSERESMDDKATYGKSMAASHPSSKMAAASSSQTQECTVVLVSSHPSTSKTVGRLFEWLQWTVVVVPDQAAALLVDRATNVQLIVWDLTPLFTVPPSPVASVSSSRAFFSPSPNAKDGHGGESTGLDLELVSRACSKFRLYFPHFRNTSSGSDNTPVGPPQTVKVLLLLPIHGFSDENRLQIATGADIVCRKPLHPSRLLHIGVGPGQVVPPPRPALAGEDLEVSSLGLSTEGAKMFVLPDKIQTRFQQHDNLDAATAGSAAGAALQLVSGAVAAAATNVPTSTSSVSSDVVSESAPTLESTGVAAVPPGAASFAPTDTGGRISSTDECTAKGSDLSSATLTRRERLAAARAARNSSGVRGERGRGRGNRASHGMAQRGGLQGRRPPEASKVAFRTLLVEDNRVNAIVFTKLMQKLFPNVDVEIAWDGQQGLDAFRAAATGCTRSGGEASDGEVEKASFSIIFMDVNMPVMNGLESTKAIREMEEKLSLPRIPIIAMSAHAMVSEVQRCHAAGMDDSITKPYSALTLKTAVLRRLPDRFQQQGTAQKKATGGEKS